MLAKESTTFVVSDRPTFVVGLDRDRLSLEAAEGEAADLGIGLALLPEDTAAIFSPSFTIPPDLGRRVIG